MQASRSALVLQGNYNYDLFRAEKALSFSRSGQSKGEPVEVQVVTHASSAQHTLFALYLSNNCLVLYYIDQSAPSIPVIRTFRWLESFTSRVVALHFEEPSSEPPEKRTRQIGRSLMCLCEDSTIVILPAQNICTLHPPDRLHQAEQPHQAPTRRPLPRPSSSSSAAASIGVRRPGSLRDWTESIVVIPAVKIPSRKLGLLRASTYQADTASACYWWTCGDHDIFVVGTRKGRLYFVDPQRPPPYTPVQLARPDRKLKKGSSATHIVKIELVSGVSVAGRYLLIRTADGLHWKLPVERRTRAGTDEFIFGKGPLSAFVAEILPFPAYHQLGISRVRRSASVCTFDPHARRLDVYDDLEKFALFLYQFPPGDSIDTFHFTDKFTFLFCRPSNNQQQQQQRHGSTGPLQHEADADLDQDGGGGDYRRRPLGEDESVVISIISNHMAGTGNLSRQPRSKQQESVMQTIVLPAGEVVLGTCSTFASFSSSLPSSNGSSAASSSSSSESLEGFWFWTNVGLYRCEPNQNHQQIFFELIGMGLEKTLAEPLGNTLGLDLLNLYEQLADRNFEQKNYGRALDLYYLSNVDSAKLAAKFLSIDRIDIVLTHLRTALHNPQALSFSERRRFSDLLLGCYLHQQLALTPSDDQELLRHEADYSEFLRGNADFDLSFALQLLTSVTPSSSFNLSSFLDVAKRRDMIPVAIDMLSQHGRSFLWSEQDLEVLSSDAAFGGHIPFALFASLPCDCQLSLLTKFKSVTANHLSFLLQLLPTLQPQQLGRFLAAWNPASSPMLDAVRASVDLYTGYIELYLYGLLLYRSHLQSHHLQRSTADEDAADAANDEETSVSNNNNNNEHSLHSEEGDSPSSATMTAEEAQAQAAAEERANNPPEVSCRLVACGGNHVAVVDRHGRVFEMGPHTCGEDCSQGQISMGVQVSHAVLVRFPRSKVRVTTLACGTSHTVAIDSQGTAWAWGSGQHGQLGCGVRVEMQREPVMMVRSTEPRRTHATSSMELLRFRTVACGVMHTLLADKKGRVWACGSNAQGQLGLKDRSGNDGVLTPQLLRTLVGEQITQVACGPGHSAALSTAGHVYTWGSGVYGQLGHGSFEDKVEPTLVQSLCNKRIKAVACGGMHTMVLTDLENLYTWGKGSHGRLGHGDIDNQATPRLVDFLLGKSVSLIAAGYQHSLAVSSDSLGLSSWGCGELGQLGTGNCQASFLPDGVPALAKQKITSIACGEGCSAAITDDETVFVWGSNEHGQLGLPLEMSLDLNAAFAATTTDNNKITNVPISLAFPAKPVPRAPKLLVQTTPLSDSPSSSDLSASASFSLSSASSSISLSSEHIFDGAGNPQAPPAALYATTETIFRAHFLSYRPSFVIETAVSLSDYDVAAAVYDLLREPVRAFDCRLLSLRRQRSLSTEQQVSRLLHMLDRACDPGAIAKEALSAIVMQFLIFFADLAPSAALIAKVERHFLSNMPVYAPPLLDLMRKHSEDLIAEPWLLQFSPQLYLGTTNFAMKEMADQAAKQTPVSKEKLWAEIRDNLTNNLEATSRKRSFVSIPTISFKGLRSEFGAHSEVIVFSCEHAFDRTYFINKLLPSYHDRFISGEGMEVLSALIQADYKLPFVNLSCPNCLQHLD